MKLALVQQRALESIDDNIQRGIDAVKQAAHQGANVICFAELAFSLFYPQKPATDDELAKAETIPGPITDCFCALAKELGVVIVLNLFEREGEHTYDSSPIINCDGSILSVTRMVHITEYEYFHEQGYYAPGNRGTPVVKTPFGSIGVAICYDRHFPEYMRALGLKGADLVIVPQAGGVGEWPEGLYEAEMRVAAFQNGYFTALCNRVGQEEFLNFAGESFVCDPFGSVVARAKQSTDEILVCDIDLEKVQKSYARRLFFHHRRPDLYSDWLS